MIEKSIKISVDSAELDVAIERAKQLVELLREANKQRELKGMGNEYIDIRVKMNTDSVLKRWKEAKEAAKDLNIKMIALGEIISQACEITGEKPEE